MRAENTCLMRRGLSIHIPIVIGMLLGLSFFPARLIADWSWWATIVDLSATGQNAETPQIVADKSGNVTAVWTRWNGSNWIVQSARFTDDRWGSPVDLSSAGQNAIFPQLAVDSNGNVTALWMRFNGVRNVIQSARYSSGWGDATDVSAPNQDAWAPKVVADSSGNVTAVWTVGGAHYIIQTARYSNDTWSTPVDLSVAAHNADGAEVAVDGGGNVTVVWMSDRLIQSARYSSGSWSNPVDLGVASEEYSHQVVADDSGNVTVVWAGPDRQNYGSTIIQSVRYSNGAWSDAAYLSDAGRYAGLPQVAVEGSGDVTAVWGSGVIQSARYSNGTWGGITDITTMSGFLPQVTADSGGNVTAVWNDFSEVVQSARHSNGVWSLPIDLNAVGQYLPPTNNSPQIAVDGGGNVTALWVRSGIIQSRRGSGDPETFTLTVGTAGVGSVASAPVGVDCGVTCTAKFTSGQPVTLTTSPAAGYTFAGWSGACSGTDVCTVTMDANKAVTATFEILTPPTYTLTVSKIGQGKITSSPDGIDCGSACSAEFSQGTSVSLNVEPEAGYAFGGWSGACAGTGPCVLTMDGAKTVEASFSHVPVGPQTALNVVIAKGQGVVSSYPAGIACGTQCSASFAKESKVRLYATPAPGYKFKGWTGACMGKKPCAVGMKKNRTVKANFVVLRK